jgi:hypothetical protein
MSMEPVRDWLIFVHYIKSKVLHCIGAVRSESEFSIDWLGRSDCYLRTLRFKRSAPSVGSVAMCTSKLRHYGQRMLATKEHKQLGEQFVGLSNACHHQIDA